MKIKHILPIAVAALLVTGAASGVVMAKDNGQENDAAMLATAKVTLQQAITTAEQQTGGRATSADLAQEKGVVQIEVEVMMTGSQEAKTVLVNAQTGQVTATRAADKADQDND